MKTTEIIIMKLREERNLGISGFVTLCGWSAKQMIPLSVFARNQTKA